MSNSHAKVWLITGCSTGFGLALTRIVLQRGHKVIATSRDPSRTPELVQEVTDGGGHWTALDVTSDHLEQDIQQIEDRLGQIDVLVNNAGYSLLGAFEDLSVQDAREQMETNFFGPLRIIRAVLPGMRERRGGTMVNISSTAGVRALPTYSLYSASKFAMEGLSEGLASEVAAFNVRVILVEPGAFYTNFLTSGSAAYRPVSEVYRDTETGRRLASLQAMHAQQRGDPVKAARRIFDTVMGEGMAAGRQTYLRLPLGPDCLEAVRQKLGQLQENYDAMEDIASSTDRAP
ncbi:putative short chain oxidoreductase/dehydrogenase [Aspergillus coremiiformis]|uniref:Putative short chain oxidoreductase/dehydrogenase n=1 Tax=Aspergillus coremiiformis TaxID=138285 RepID=A0A5N6ZE36_9EURO|nr:putative short chain oxidoreductase/dehydrogenase [Aspergillus coremiiformis]